jgi:hypothetical protein
MPARSIWQSWPVLPGLAGYSVVDLDPYRDPGLTSWRPHAMGDARLAGHGVCAERGASVQSWFGQYFTATSGNDWTIRLRQEPKSGLVVATVEPTRLGAERVEPQPIVAFRVERDGPVYLVARILALPALVLALLTGWLWRARGRAAVTGIATLASLAQAGCERAPPALAPSPRPTLSVAPSIEPVPSPSNGAPASVVQTRPLVLHTIASTQVPARVYVGDATTRILVSSCIAEVSDTTITAGHYPLPGRACREPLQQLASFGGREWLQAGPEVWVRTSSGPWHLDTTLQHADHVLFPTGGTAGSLALVIPFRQSARSDYQVSSSFELQRLGGSGRPKMPLAARAQASANMPFDDFISECFTKTRLATPKAFRATTDGQLQVLGTECDRDDQSLGSVIETWRAGSTTSSVEALPFARPERLLQAQVDNENSIWALQSSQLLHFDGTAWSEMPLPAGVASVTSFSASASGTLWVLASTGELWERRSGQPWEARTTSVALEAVSRMAAEGDDTIWLSTETALFSSRALPTGPLCQTPCADFWHESARLSRIPHGD